MINCSNLDYTTPIYNGVMPSILTAVSLPEIHLVHLGSFTYMVNGEKLLVVCDRDLDETPMNTAVEILGWRLIQDFPSVPERERLIDWVLDNRIHLIPLGSRTDRVAARAERRVREFIEESFHVAKTDLDQKSRDRAMARLISCQSTFDYDGGSTGVNLHEHSYLTGGNGGFGLDHNHVNYDRIEYQQSLMDSFCSEMGLDRTQTKSRLYRPRPIVKPTIQVVSVCKGGFELADGRKFKFQ